MNSGDITATATGPFSYGISAATHGANSPIDIGNRGTIDPKVDILSFAYAANSPTTVTNTARSNRPISASQPAPPRAEASYQLSTVEP